MTGIRVAVVGVVIVAFLVWLTGEAIWLGFGVVVVLVMFLNARDWSVWGRLVGDEPTAAPRIAPHTESIDIGEELVDLLTSAAYRSARMLEDHGVFDPFVMYEDAEGNVRVRSIDAGEPARVLSAAREAARSLDATVPRVVLAVVDLVELDGRRRSAVRYEAAERGFRDRTFAFVQPIRARRLFIPATTEGPPAFVGDGDHALRFAADG